MPPARQHGSGRQYGDYVHPNPNRTHENDLQAITNSLGYRNGNRGRVGVAFRGGAMNGGVGCSLLRRPIAQYDERRA